MSSVTLQHEADSKSPPMSRIQAGSGKQMNTFDKDKRLQDPFFASRLEKMDSLSRGQ